MNLRQWRDERDLTVKQLADYLRVTPQAVRNWEAGHRAMPQSLEDQLANYGRQPDTMPATTPPQTQGFIDKDTQMWNRWAKKEIKKYQHYPNYLPVVMEGEPNQFAQMWLGARGEWGPHGHWTDDGWFNMPIGIYFYENGDYAGYEYLDLDHNVIEHPRAKDYPRMKSGHYKPTFCIGNPEWDTL